MLDIIIDAWKNTTGNPYNPSYREIFSDLSKPEKICLGVLASELLMSLVLIVLSPFFFPTIANQVLFVSVLTIAITLAVCAINDRKIRGTRAVQYRNSKIDFYAELRKTFELYGLSTNKQLEHCLDWVARELNARAANRNMAATTISVFASVVVAFSALLLSRLIEETGSIYEAMIYIFVVGLILIMLLISLYSFVTDFLPSVSPRERLLTCFSNDLSAFLLYGMQQVQQQENLQRLINAGLVNEESVHAETSTDILAES